MKFKQLTVFGVSAGKDGQNTLRFEDGDILSGHEQEHTEWEFTYTSASTGYKNKARFYKNNISGVAYNNGDSVNPPGTDA